MVREEEDEDDTQTLSSTKNRRNGGQKVDPFLVGTELPDLLEKVIQLHGSARVFQGAVIPVETLKE